MCRSILLAATAGAIIVSAGWASAQHVGHQSHQGHGTTTMDTRELVKFPPQMIEHTLANMRDHLLALQEINDALAQGLNDKAAKVAEERLE